MMNQMLSLDLDRSRHSTKKELKSIYGLSSTKKRPPKLPTKRAYIRRLFTTRPTALLINSSGLSTFYNESLNSSYFDQCFDPIMKLGEGSFGEVYKVRSKEDGMCYAIKRTKECFRSSTDREEKIAEVRKHERIPQHENCISLIGAWEQDDHVYLQMELGCTSLDVYAENESQISESRLWNILLDMLLALQNLHDNNLVHLDVKLENIIICEDGCCKLGDFGLMIDLKGDLSNATEGDAKYLAPELMEGKFTKAADVFSLGISLLELATDISLPSNGQLWHELRDSIFPPDVRRKVPKQLFNFVQRMMTRDHKKRPSVRTLLKHPRIKSMLKERREAGVRCVTPGGHYLTSVMRTSTPVRDLTPPLPVDVTPPLGYNTPSTSLLLSGLDSDLDSSPVWSPKFQTPMPCHHTSRGLPLQTSAKKLDFLDSDN